MEIGVENLSDKKKDIKELIGIYIKQWKWFVICIIIALGIAFLKIRYTIPEYSAIAKIQILEDNGPSPELNVFKDLDIFSGQKNNVEDEIEIINSRSNLIEVVNDLGLNIKISVLGNIKSSELYRNPPFNINFIAPDSIINKEKTKFYLELGPENTFKFTVEEGNPYKVFMFGKNIPTSIGDIIITPNLSIIDNYLGKRFSVEIMPVEFVAENYQKKIIIEPADKLSNIANISLNDPIARKAKDILNALVAKYNENAILDKKIIADKTSEFINDRIASISSSLSSVDETAQEFKSDRGLTDIASEASLNLNIGASTRQELQNANVQLNTAISMQNILENQEGYEVLPSNIGLSDQSIANTTARYNELALQRKRLLKSSNDKNPIIVNLDQQLEGLKRNMQSSLNSMANNLGLTVNSLSNQQSRINSRIYSVPKNEKALRDITRKQQTTEALYLYLLQKREESQVSYASASPKSKIVDSAYSSGLQVLPKPTIIYIAAFLLGILVPFSIIYVKDILDDKVHNKIGLEKLIKNIPILGELPNISKKDKKLIFNNDRSILAESLRILRTNLDYLMKSKNSAKATTNNNIIYVTSSIPGEGKTFVSSNLAIIFASTGKKVLLIGGDIRNPKLSSFFGNDFSKKLSNGRSSIKFGLTEYLSDDNVSINQIINKKSEGTHQVDMIFSGKIPPNPAELLMSEKIKILLDEVSDSYDYIIVDTAPLMVVSDTVLISKYADHIIYVTRAGYTETKVLEFPLKLHKEGKLNGLSFIVNDVKNSNLGYGGKYGYGYGRSTKKWWKF